MTRIRPRLAVWKLASCDGCQLTLLDCEDELLQLAEHVEIAYFAEATSRPDEGRYDVSLVEGSITTADDVERIHHIRDVSQTLVTLGACATSGGIQALRNLADIDDFLGVVYAHPAYVSTLATSTPVADHVRVDVELRGCPIDRRQLLQVVTALVHGGRTHLPVESVCADCKRRGVTCVTVAHGTPCLGPATMAGCGALCPRYHRGCYGCFGPVPDPNLGSLRDVAQRAGMADDELIRMLRAFTVGAGANREASERFEGGAR